MEDTLNQSAALLASYTGIREEGNAFDRKLQGSTV